MLFNFYADHGYFMDELFICACITVTRQTRDFCIPQQNAKRIAPNACANVDDFVINQYVI